MNTKTYINQDILERLLANSGNVDNVSKVLVDLKSKESYIAHRTLNPYVYVNRLDEVKILRDFLTDTSQKLYLISGLQGTGKTALVRSVLATCNEEILVYWYECSKITNLDDLLLSICGFFDKKLAKNTVKTKERLSVSIDERLINYLKNLDRPLIFVLDSLEYLVSPSFTIEDDELKHFFNYLLNHENVKLILMGQRLPKSDMDYVDEFITEVKISGLSEENSINLLRENNLIDSKSVLSEIYKYARGYPWVLLLTTKVSPKLNMTASQIIANMANYEDSFESYLIKEVYQKLSLEEIKLLNYLCILRHPVNTQSIIQLDSQHSKLDSEIEDLTKLLLIRSTINKYHVNNAVRRYVYNLIPVDQKYTLHSNVSKFYSNEISKKLADRSVRISRKLLHSEQSFHNMSATKLYTEKDKFDKKRYLASNYFPTATPVQTTSLSNTNLNLAAPLPSQVEEIKNIPVNNVPETTEPDKTLPDKSQYLAEKINIDGLEIELSEEEKELLQQEISEVSQIPLTAKEENDYEEKTDTSNKDDFTFNLHTSELVRSDMEDNTINPDLVDSLLFVAKTYADESKYNTALERYKEVLDISEKFNQTDIIAKTLMPMAESFMAIKQYDRAIEAYQKCKDIYQNNLQTTKVADVLAHMGKIYFESYQHEKAIQCYNDALKMPVNHLPNNLKASIYNGIAEVFEYREKYTEALEYYNVALNYLKEIDDTLNQAIIYSKIGLIYDDLADYNNAVINYENAIKLDMQVGRKQDYASTLANLAAVYDEIGEKFKSLNYYKQALIIDKETNNIEGLYKTLGRMGTLYIELGKTSNALKYYQQELAVAKKAKNPYWIAMAYLDLGDLFYFTKDYTRAAKYFYVSQKVISKSISTDSKEKIERRISKLKDHIPEDQLEKIKLKVSGK